MQMAKDTARPEAERRALLAEVESIYKKAMDDHPNYAATYFQYGNLLQEMVCAIWLGRGGMMEILTIPILFTRTHKYIHTHTHTNRARQMMLLSSTSGASRPQTRQKHRCASWAIWARCSSAARPMPRRSTISRLCCRFVGISTCVLLCWMCDVLGCRRLCGQCFAGPHLPALSQTRRSPRTISRRSMGSAVCMAPSNSLKSLKSISGLLRCVEPRVQRENFGGLCC